METAIQTKDLTKEYRQGKNIVMGVDHVNISVASGSSLRSGEADPVSQRCFTC